MSVDAAPRKDPFGLAGVLLDGRFRIEREVAEGGFGVVYSATQVALDRPVAIKVLKTPPGFDEAAKVQFRDRFASEAKTIARIRHPHIVDVYDFGILQMPTGEIAPWMALEWLQGETLEEQLAARRGRGGQTPTDVLTIFRPILQAFAFAHKQGIAHRDIKPANIMAVPTEHGMMMRVLDFGIAKLVNPEEAAGTGHTKTSGIPAFSPLYAAPEQIAFGRTGPWTDVHALGLILTEFLTDQPPYRAEDMQLFEEIIAQKRPTPALRGIDVGAWESVLQKAVSLSPSERWKSASELLTVLEANVGKSADSLVEIGSKASDAKDAPASTAGAAGRPAPASFRATGETAMEIEGMRAAGRRNRGWIAAVVSLAVVGAIAAALALRTSASPAASNAATAAASSPPAAPPSVEPSKTAPTGAPAPAASAARTPAQAAKAAAPDPAPAELAKQRSKPTHHPVAQRKTEHFEIE
jgi:hypothetical protein